MSAIVAKLELILGPVVPNEGYLILKEVNLDTDLTLINTGLGKNLIALLRLHQFYKKK